MASLYTVEQIELLRRLRLTGITGHQIIEAFNTFDRLDYELMTYDNQQQHQLPAAMTASGGGGGSIFGTACVTTVKAFRSPYESLLGSLPTTTTDPPNNNNNNDSSPTSQNNKPSVGGSRRKRSIAAADQSIIGTTSSYQDRQDECLINFGGGSGGNEETAVAESVQNSTWPGAGGEQQQATENGCPIEQWNQIDSEIHQRLLASEMKPKRKRRPPTGPRPVVIRRPPQPPPIDYATYVDDAQLEQFLSAGEDLAIKEIKDYVTDSQLRQQHVANMTGVSQPYVSRFLSGSQRDLSSRVRRVLYRWYLAVKANPDLLLVAIPEPIRSSGDTAPPTMVPSNNNSSAFVDVDVDGSMQGNDGIDDEDEDEDDSMIMNGDGSSSQSYLSKENSRRDRFVFKSIHTRILQKYFSTDPYPSVKKREEIATACNRAYENEGKFAPPQEQLTAHVVGTWFSNRRKEKRRRGELKLRRFRRPRYTLPRFDGLSPAAGSNSSKTQLSSSFRSGQKSELVKGSKEGETSARCNNNETKRESGVLDSIVDGLHAMNNNIIIPLGDDEQQ